MMRAAYCREFGACDVVTVEEVDSPPIAAGQARVKIETAAVNYPDVLLVAHQYQVKVPTPFVVGSEFAGEVVEVGDGVDSVTVGDRVFGSSLIGAFATEIVVGAASLTVIPDGVSVDAAAGFGVAHRTAYNTLRSIAQLRAGEELIVLGAGGGVGLAAVQLGAVLGATVTAVASSDAKLTAARDCGATHGINYKTADLRQTLREVLTDGADVVVDPVGGDLSEAALRALRPGGRFVTVGYASGVIPRIPLNLVLLKAISVMGFEFLSFATHHGEAMTRNEHELIELLRSGKATPYVEAEFDLDDVAAALRHVAEGKAIGKVLLHIA
jgi:NADPH2:quinone reductase